MASNHETGTAFESSTLDQILAAHERQLDEVLDHVIGVLVAARAAQAASSRATETASGSHPPER